MHCDQSLSHAATFTQLINHFVGELSSGRQRLAPLRRGARMPASGHDRVIRPITGRLHWGRVVEMPTLVRSGIHPADQRLAPLRRVHFPGHGGLPLVVRLITGRLHCGCVVVLILPSR